MLKQEIRRVLLSPFFYLAIVIMFIGSYMPVVDEAPYNNDIVYLFWVMGLGHGGMLAPIMSCLAVADSYLIEHQSGYYYAVMSRSTKLKYCFSKMGVAIATGISIVLITKLLLLAALMIGAQIMHGDFNWGNSAIESIGPSEIWIAKRKFGLYIGQIILYDCMYASIFPGIALVVSTIMKNKYIVMLFPFFYSEVTSFVFIGLECYYLAPTLLDSEGAVINLLPYEGLPFRIMVILLYWIIETSLFTRGIWKETK